MAKESCDKKYSKTNILIEYRIQNRQQMTNVCLANILLDVPFLNKNNNFLQIKIAFILDAK